MPWAIFEAVLEAALAPPADPLRQAEAFYAGLRPVGLDGTQFSLSNTPAVLGTMTRAASQRFARPQRGDHGNDLGVEGGSHNALHPDFKPRVPRAIGLIRTGDPTPYSNMILDSA